MIRKVAVVLLLMLLAVPLIGLLATFAPDSALNRSAAYYATNTVGDTGAQNIVAAIIVTYRGLDTLGEVTVLFLTAAIVAIVLAGSHAPRGTLGAGMLPAGELLNTGARLLVPLIVLFGAYVFINGHLTPGGGFQGGAILASAMLLILLADPARRFSRKVIGRVESISGFIYVILGVLGALFAGGFLDNRILPLGSLGAILSAGAIPVIYTLIGLKVGAEFSSMLESLEETEDR